MQGFNQFQKRLIYTNMTFSSCQSSHNVTWSVFRFLQHIYIITSKQPQQNLHFYQLISSTFSYIIADQTICSKPCQNSACVHWCYEETNLPEYTQVGGEVVQDDHQDSLQYREYKYLKTFVTLLLNLTCIDDLQIKTEQEEKFPDSRSVCLPTLKAQIKPRFNFVFHSNLFNVEILYWLFYTFFVQKHIVYEKE